MASRHLIPSDDLAELIKEFALGDVIDWRHLTDGLMNVNWQLDTPRGTFALKRVTYVPLDSLRRNLAVSPALAEAGIPVIVPVAASSGGVVVEVGGRRPTGSPLLRGPTVRVTPSTGQHLMPSPSVGCCSPSTRPCALRETFPQGRTAGRTAFSSTGTSFLWADGGLTAVLDWDQLGVRPYAEEDVRTAQVQFGVEGVFDLERVSAFVSGYRSVIPLEPAALLDAARRLWWKRMTDFWQLEFHYDRGDHSCDDLFIADEALLHWCRSRPGDLEGV